MGQNYFLLRGYVLDTANNPLPGASIRVFNTQLGTQSDNEGRFELKLEQGFHKISVTYLGFTPQTVEVVIDQNEVQNFILEVNKDLMEDLVVNVKKKDYSYEVIKNVIEHKEEWQKQYANAAFDVYTKAISNASYKAPKKEEEDPNQSLPDSLINYVFFESNAQRFIAPPNGFKEIRQGVKKIGNVADLFGTQLAHGQFDLYQNMQSIPKIGDKMLVSPFSVVGYLGYKFKLLETYFDNNRMIYRIEVKPKDLSNALYEGEVEIIDKLWCIHKVHLSIPKKSMLNYQEFDFSQQYDLIQGKRVVVEERFQWSNKTSAGTSGGATEISYSHFTFDSTYAKNFFGAEQGSTTKEAYGRDSSYWEAIRPAPLPEKERLAVKQKELELVRLNSKEYLDSVDAVYNKLNFHKITWKGIGYINRAEKKEWFFAPILGLVNPISIGGPRLMYNLSYFKKYENRKSLRITPSASYGFLNKDLMGRVIANYYYNPIRQSSISGFVYRGFGVINGSATINDIIRRSNFFLQTQASLTHRTELFNGFYVSTSLGIQNRRDLSDYEFTKIGDELFDQNKPITFANTNIIDSHITIDFTPRQLYVKEPNEKIVLGSKYPTFSLRLNMGNRLDKGLKPGFANVEFLINQQFNVGLLGTSKYRVALGKFLDTTYLAPMDYMYQRGGDPLWFTPSMYTYQLIPNTFATFDWYLETHYEHQFNGFFTSKIPLINKLGIRETAGGGVLYVPELSYNYQELYGGVNRVFRIGQAMFRLGAYYVVSQSNTAGFRSGFKFSFEPYDRNKNSWSF